MYRYAYLALALCFLVSAGLIWLVRRDLRRNILVLGSFGLIWGPISEYWFRQDYWVPTSIFSGAWLEDCIYGAGIAATAGTVYKLFTRKVLVQDGKRRYWIALAFPACYVTGMVIFQQIYSANSIYVSMSVYLLVSFVVLFIRRDLLLPAMASGTIMAAVAIVGYGVGLTYIIDGKLLLSKFWLLDGRPGGWTLWNAPVTELMWYFCWGVLLGVAYEFGTGARLSNRESGKDVSRSKSTVGAGRGRRTTPLLHGHRAKL